MGTEERRCEGCGAVGNWSHNGLQCIDPLHYSIVRRERDDARRIARGLALLIRGRSVDSVFEDLRTYDANVATALAYKVDP